MPLNNEYERNVYSYDDVILPSSNHELIESESESEIEQNEQEYRIDQQIDKLKPYCERPIRERNQPEERQEEQEM